MAEPYWHHRHMRDIAIPVAEAMEAQHPMVEPGTVLPALRAVAEADQEDVRLRRAYQQQNHRTVTARLTKSGVIPPEKKMYICRCPPPYPLIPGRKIPQEYEDYFQHRAIQDDEIQKEFDTISPVAHEGDDCTKMGYWSIIIPKINSVFMEKTALCLQLMAGSSPLTSVFIDSPDVSIRFDLRRRAEGKLRVQAEPRHPSMPRDAIPWTTHDPDSLIVDHKQYKDPLKEQEISDAIRSFRIQVMRLAYRNQTTFVKKSRNDLLMSWNSKNDEVRARGLLCEMIGFEEFKQYLRRGFIVVKGKSGMLYKISGGHSMIEVYQREDETGNWYHRESICIQFDDFKLPHTDGVIMRKLFVESDEFGLRKMANVTEIQRERVG